MPTPFLSYPKSGRTWIRFMIDDYLVRLGQISVANVFAVEKHPLITPPVVLGNPFRYPFAWTHLTGAMLMDLPYDMMGAIDYRQFDGKRMIFLTRNFHATMASAYRHAVHRIHRWDGSASEFLRDPVYGFMKLITLYNMWERIQPRLADHLIVSYEETRQDPVDVVRRCLRFAEVPVDESTLQQSVEAGAFDRMKALSQSPAYAQTPLAPADPNNPQSFKVRSGSSGDDNLFTEADINFMDRLTEDLLINQALAQTNFATGPLAQAV